ncbi:MAG TPA: trans-aconitate 2-methyltransferase [Paracoccus sp. (in: a-proteobacteria)]|uniref:trans-aconitate 2-methyltransferase n=1 Tax=Paracoccus sp. TaxID=267 RepID=UPI002BD368DD|nr:trans-aconitate 2-methyltransferase [Paracoccus sp. (in: a-proteobacteria)]HWL57785.1 trans-aconitate 2-methyltransferase [Paracoccus sp. (in: a-proteobacteria)]
MGWSASQYSRFLDDRTRPARDLLNAVPVERPDLVVDLGSGPGNSTALLARRYPAARIVGIDSDPDMIATARRKLPECEFLPDTIEDWRPTTPPDVIFANASLQWVEDHEALFVRLVNLLSPGGALAVQMPDNLDEPSHRAMRKVADDPRWSARMGSANARRKPLMRPPALHALLRPHATRVDIWRTVYNHELEGVDAIVEWFKGSALRPYLATLDVDEQASFLHAYREEIAPAYPESDGRCLLAFPRLFFVASRAEA